MRSSGSMSLKDTIRSLANLEPNQDDQTIPWFSGAITLDDELRPPAPPSVPPAPTGPPPPGIAPVVPRQGSGLVDEGEIGRGGMGSIRKLYDPELRRRVAMKLLEHSRDPDSAQRFIDEARITGLLDHPNIVPVHDLVIENDGLVTYTMKLVKGETLTELIARQKTISDLEHILNCLIKVCEALSFAHGHGVIHRDLKPDNIMVGSHGQVYLMDWGCAHVVGDDRSIVEGRQDKEGMLVGTLSYMAPEQAKGQITKIDARTDVFGVGAILYKVITGSPPYPYSGLQAIPFAQEAEIQPPEQSAGSAIKPPPHLSEIAMTAMAKDPENRFQSTQALAGALRSFLKGGNWFPLQRFVPGAVIVREGDSADAAYIITQGQCEVRKADPSAPGGVAVLRMLGAGDVFGETAIFAKAPRSASVVAIDEVLAVIVDRASIERLTETSWLGLFVKALADRFLDVDARLSRSE